MFFLRKKFSNSFFHIVIRFFFVLPCSIFKRINLLVDFKVSLYYFQNHVRKSKTSGQEILNANLPAGKYITKLLLKNSSTKILSIICPPSYVIIFLRVKKKKEIKISFKACHWKIKENIWKALLLYIYKLHVYNSTKIWRKRCSFFNILIHIVFRKSEGPDQIKSSRFARFCLFSMEIF